MHESKTDSYRYFENRACCYYPCHSGEHLNCLFCYCPLYFLPDCPGNYQLLEKNGRTIKSCVSCDFPHREENYEAVMALLKKAIRGEEE